MHYIKTEVNGEEVCPLINSHCRMAVAINRRIDKWIPCFPKSIRQRFWHWQTCLCCVTIKHVNPESRFIRVMIYIQHRKWKKKLVKAEACRTQNNASQSAFSLHLLIQSWDLDGNAGHCPAKDIQVVSKWPHWAQNRETWNTQTPYIKACVVWISIEHSRPIEPSAIMYKFKNFAVPTNQQSPPQPSGLGYPVRSCPASGAGTFTVPRSVLAV